MATAKVINKGRSKNKVIVPVSIEVTQSQYLITEISISLSRSDFSISKIKTQLLH